MPYRIHFWKTWLGQVTPIELLCSYINCDGIQKIIRLATTIPGKKTGSSYLNGYQTKNKESVYKDYAEFFQINDEMKGEPLAYVYYEIETKSGR